MAAPAELDAVGEEDVEIAGQLEEMSTVEGLDRLGLGLVSLGLGLEPSSDLHSTLLIELKTTESAFHSMFIFQDAFPPISSLMA